MNEDTGGLETQDAGHTRARCEEEEELDLLAA